MKLSRLVVLFGLLAGLLFSYGEGIRLLPFNGPNASANAEFSSERPVSVEYQKNILRISKPRKDEGNSSYSLDLHDIQAVQAASGSISFIPSLVLVEIPKAVSETAFASSRFAASVKGRAPPVS